MQIISNMSNMNMFSSLPNSSTRNETEPMQKSVNAMLQQASQSESFSNVASQENKEAYKVVSSSKQTSSSESLQGERKIEETRTIERIVSQRERGNLLDVSV